VACLGPSETMCRGLAREWPTATCNVLRSNEPAKQSENVQRTRCTRGGQELYRRGIQDIRQRTKGVPFSPDN
jgi:hypothetical protein